MTDQGRRERADTAVRREPPLLNWANAFTMLRVVLVPVIAIFVFTDGATARWWAFAIFVFAALTDSIDGWVARRLIGVTRWGALADPVADKALIIGSLTVLAINGELPWVAVAIIVIREFGVTAQRTVLVRRGVVMPASRFGKAKTVSQVAAVTLYLMPVVRGGLPDAALATAVLLTVASGVDYALRGARTAHAR
ncbi:MAG: CDP-diacylglycerol--glycerol-3-phosphate 3-phosphatidyltransferase [Nitriliruptorales bacterium]|nr:CDP-diacylglycerol--glycerol-3-phosphate 3-phosphatidyltransferase [Nitriliruptorales bacterium]